MSADSTCCNTSPRTSGGLTVAASQEGDSFSIKSESCQLTVLVLSPFPLSCPAHRGPGHYQCPRFCRDIQVWMTYPTRPSLRAFCSPGTHAAGSTLFRSFRRAGSSPCSSPFRCICFPVRPLQGLSSFLMPASRRVFCDGVGVNEEAGKEHVLVWTLDGVVAHHRSDRARDDHTLDIRATSSVISRQSLSPVSLGSDYDSTTTISSQPDALIHSFVLCLSDERWMLNEKV